MTNWSLFTLIACAAPVGAGGLALRVSTETAPPGWSVQIKVFLQQPVSVAGGGASIDFDPAFFDDIAGFTAFSATGDVLGYANISGRHLEAHFSSASGSIGQSPDLPVFVVEIPVPPSRTARGRVRPCGMRG
jgi:hypothetical protein